MFSLLTCFRWISIARNNIFGTDGIWSALHARKIFQNDLSTTIDSIKTSNQFQIDIGIYQIWSAMLMHYCNWYCASRSHFEISHFSTNWFVCWEWHALKTFHVCFAFFANILPALDLLSLPFDTRFNTPTRQKPLFFNWNYFYFKFSLKNCSLLKQLSITR